MYTVNKDYVLGKYKVKMLRDIENYVAGLVDVQVPFSNYITGYTAFVHKAGIHAKAMLNNPSTYEILNPEDFGMTRYIAIAHRLTGWNAIKSRCEQLNLTLSDDEVKEATNYIKKLADIKKQTLDDVDNVLYSMQNSKKLPPMQQEVTVVNGNGNGHSNGHNGNGVH